MQVKIRASFRINGSPADITAAIQQQIAAAEREFCEKVTVHTFEDGDGRLVVAAYGTKTVPLKDLPMRM